MTIRPEEGKDPNLITSNRIAKAVREGLKELDLSGLHMTALPHDIVLLSELETLILDDNGSYYHQELWFQNFYDDFHPGLDKLPNELGALRNLRRLSRSEEHT